MLQLHMMYLLKTEMNKPKRFSLSPVFACDRLMLCYIIGAIRARSFPFTALTCLSLHSVTCGYSCVEQQCLEMGRGIMFVKGAGQ